MTPAPRFARWWWVGFGAALRSLPASRSLPALRQSARLLLCPIDLWRYYELAAVADAIGQPNRILDIGSPKAIAPILQASLPSPIVCSDIAWDAVIATGKDSLPLQCDALYLPFADASLLHIYSVSAIEHIAGDGDRGAMREIARVLAPGGVAVVTVPLVPRYTERWIASDPYGKQARDAEGRVFFSRYYDGPSLQERIIGTPGLRVVRTSAWQETRDGWYAKYCRSTERATSVRSVITKLFDPLWAAYRIEAVAGGPENATRHGVVAIVFEKT